MTRPAHITRPEEPTASSKKTLKELFEERNRTRPGSKEEEQAAEKIAEAIFPDSNAS
jgi:hypothetical protein